jgi:CheY-like chemotaxis protein
MPPTHGQGQVLGTIAVDITERCRANEALLLAKAAAEAANAAKSVFLSNISHEIRTPLNAVIGVTHLLAESGLNDDQRALLYKAQLAGRSLLGIINDVLDLSKIEAGEITLDEAPYQPVALLEEIEAVYAPQARKKGLNFTVTVSSDLPSWLQCDSSRLRQVLINLVANALKFTDRGGVDVQLSMTGRSLDRCGLLIRVRDSGIGIEPGIQERLFLPFIQADASTTRRYGGTGLGLSIVKRLVQIMGGEVGLTSTPGVGSEFWVALPQTLPGADQAESSSLGLMLLEVVVVDDNPLDRAFLASEVRALGWQALALDSGAALLEEWAARQSAGRALPDVVLVDWQMPGMDGLGTLATLAARAGPQDLPPVLMVTAYDSEHLQRLNHAGLVDHVLTKPLVPAALFNAVNQSLARRHGSTDRLLQSTRMDGSDTLWLADLRVLLVDDCDINLEVAKRLLEHRGARVRTCTGGHEALDCLRSAPADFDAVLMDVRMPDMDGLEVTRRLRSELGLVTLPVIALTAVALVEKRRRALDAGMQGFLSKPLDPVQLVRVLRGCVETARGTVLPVSGQGPRLDAVPVAWPLVGGIDADDVAARLGHDVALFSLLLRQLLREFQDLVSPPEPALASAEQRQALAARMHKLRGSAGTLGARDLHQLAEVAETSLQAFGDSRASAAVHCVSQALVRLAEQSADVLAAAHRSAPAAGSGASGPAPATAWAAPDKVRGLLRQLKSQDLAAIDSFKDLLPGLSEVLGAQATDRLSAAMDALDFAQVIELLGESPQLVQPTHGRTDPGSAEITVGYSAADTARDTGHIGLERES